MITGKNISFSYDYPGSKHRALEDIQIHVAPGELVVLLGNNGCGKSTLCRHLNALLPLQEGELTVAGISASDPDCIWELRRQVGMVFQNPDNQFVSSVVEEDVAFGLENYQVPRREIPNRVAEALAQVGLSGFEKRAPHTLSGGQKQRLSLAGVLALEPNILVLDEVTAMLDPVGRREVLDLVHALHEAGRTIVMVTHYIEEALSADRVYLMREGKILTCGTPEVLLTDMELMEQARMVPPLPVRLYYDLKREGIELSRCPLTGEELVEELCRFARKR